MAKTKTGKLCFVIMPFHDDLMPVYQAAIKPACQQTGFKAVRVDELKGMYNINREIIEHIFASEVIIADLTNWRPNVFYELGVAHAIANKTVMIINKKDEIPFDVKIYSCIQYEQTEAGLARLLTSLVASLNSFEEWRREPANPVQDHNPTICIPQPEWDECRAKLRENDGLLRQYEATVEGLQKKLVEKDALLQSTGAAMNKLREKSLIKDKLLRHAPSKTEVEALQRELAQKHNEIAALQKEIKKLRSRLAA
jgi:hypothetical protein